MTERHLSAPRSPGAFKRFLHARLARDHHLGLPLSTGLLAVLATALLFALIAYEVHTHGALTRLDQQLADWFNQRAFSPLTELVLGYTHLHGTIGVLTAQGSAGPLRCAFACRISRRTNAGSPTWPLTGRCRWKACRSAWAVQGMMP